MAVGFLAFNAFQGASVYYFTVGEALAGNVQEGATVRVSGKLLPDSFCRETEGTVAHFALVDDNSVLQATYDGILPDSFCRETEGTVAHFSLVDKSSVLQATYDGILPELFFNEHSDIVLEGSLNQDGVFNSDTIIVKCPTKYQAQA